MCQVGHKLDKDGKSFVLKYHGNTTFRLRSISEARETLPVQNIVVPKIFLNKCNIFKCLYISPFKHKSLLFVFLVFNSLHYQLKICAQS